MSAPHAPHAPFGRIVTAMVTPFAPDGSLDLAGARGLARRLVENGSEGLVLAGTTGEAPTLSDAEKLALWEAVLDEVGADARIVAGAGTNDTAHSCRLAREAARLGMHGLLVVTPYYNKPPEEGIVRHFAAISEASGGLPTAAYNIPGRVVLRLRPELLARLGREVEGVCAVKQAWPDSADARAIVASGLALYAGDDGLVEPFLELGGCGGICVASHLVGRELLRLCELVAQGDLEGARALDRELAEVYHVLSLITNPIPVKAALALCGLPAGGLRLPLCEAGEDELAELRAVLERRGLLVAS
jgi:4-hydroxy-tetrahydrodipicolinate synthase